MFPTIVMAGIGLTILAILGHLAVFGPKRSGSGDETRSVRRFRILEQLIHLATLAAFAALALTGLIAVFDANRALHGWLWVIHAIAAPVFAAGLTCTMVIWAKDARFAPCDWDWALMFGGYLWGDKHAPAERFNGGQKAYLWCVACLGFVMLATGLGRMAPVFGPDEQEALYQIHRYGALLFVMAAIVHLYLGTLANPGTFGAMISGKVTRQWAKEHHPLWWQEIDGSGNENEASAAKTAKNGPKKRKN